MKQFQKIGVAAAVASVAAGAVAQQVSRTETGDLAIVPYYTVKDGVNTGLHIINTTNSTQVVKVRLRRGTDSKDALDFNLVMSPRDEWTANIGGTGNADSPVLVTTNDTTCTVPEFPEGGAPMPSTFAAGAEEGYIEVIAMAETTDENQGIAIAAKHTDGVPASCADVRQNFYRVATADAGVDTGARGVHNSGLTSDGGACTAAVVGNTTAGCAATGTNNLSTYIDSDDNALKVSFMLTDSDGGLEGGDNAVMVEGFANGPMMTNQQPLSFGTDGYLNFDPLNFELPNLAYGSYTSTNANRAAAQAATTGFNPTDGSMWDNLADALDADSIMNDWAAFETADGTVNADWVVTLPGQYVMVDPVCDIYSTYTQGSGVSAVAHCATTAAVAYAAATAGGADQNQLPLLVASNRDGGSLVTGSNMNLWDREEASLAGTETPVVEEDPDLGFSPGGSSGDPADPDVTVTLPNEVNVIDFGEEGAASALVSDLKLTVTPSGADRGWGRLDIETNPNNANPQIWGPAALNDGDDVIPTDGGVGGVWTPVASADDVAVVGFAAWQRSFAAQAGNYGRLVEHSTITSTSTTR
jgi:hypothetical protein